MELTWLGHSCVRIRGREAIVVADPCPKDTGYNIGKQTANIVTVSHDHPAHSNVAAIGGSPRVIQAPGEYEIGGVLIAGVRTYHDAEGGAERGKNTAFLIEVDGVRICHLGDIGHVPTQDQIEQLTGADILLIPVGGGSTIDASAAARTVRLLEPRVVVPIHYQTPSYKGEPLAEVSRFLKEMGLNDIEPQPKLAANRGGLSGETRTIVLDYRG